MMTPEKYLEERVNDQINWYDRKSSTAQQWFKRLRGLEIICAALIPLLGSLSVFGEVFVQFIPLVSAVLGTIVVLLAACTSLYQNQEKWIEYRTIAEALKQEKFLFLTGAEPYNTDNPFPLFVQRVESQITKENSNWTQYARSGANASKPPAPNQSLPQLPSP